MSVEKNRDFWKTTIIITLLGLILIELSFRFLFWLQFSDHGTSLKNQAQSRWIADSTIVWSNRPFYVEYNKSFQYNEVGIRVTPKDLWMPEKKENDFWVLLLGGSAMAGMGPSNTGAYKSISGVRDHSQAQSIDGYLQELLQETFSEKKVRVFNAAVSGHSIQQSMLRYQQLKQYDFDWVISMDGMDEPKTLEEQDSTWTYIQKTWAEVPSNQEPLKGTLQWMGRSAFYYYLNKYVYHSREEENWQHLLDSLAYQQEYWQQQTSSLTTLPEISEAMINAVGSFAGSVSQFSFLLKNDLQQHMLLVQPFLALRNTDQLVKEEQAIYNYYCSLHKDTLNQYTQLLYEVIQGSSSLNKKCYTMEGAHYWKEWTFLDYCHLTDVANKKIANEIYRYILAYGDYRPFRITGRRK